MFLPAKYGYFDGRNNPRWIVIHTMEYPKVANAAEWCAQYFTNPETPRSAHYCVDANSIAQSVRDVDGAWHTTGFAAGLEINRNSIGIEHAGYAAQSATDWQDAYNQSQLDLSANLVRELARRFNIPVRHLSVAEIRAGMPGIAGHVEFNAATGSGSHTDPGTNFPWDQYIQKVQRGSAAARRASPLVLALIIGAAGLGAWAYLNPIEAKRLARKVVPI